MTSPNCKAEFHQYEATNSTFSSQMLLCIIKKGHQGIHKFEDGSTSIMDNREFCTCERCN